MAKIIEAIKNFCSGKCIFALKKKEKSKPPEEKSLKEEKPKEQK